MPDFQDYQLVVQANAQVTMFRFRLEARITDSQTGQVLFDFTGANGILFPADLPSLLTTAADRREFVEMIAHYLLRKKAGL
jgi:hypothetical protein